MGVQSPFRDISPGAAIWDYGDSPAENLVIRPTLGTIQVPVQDQLAPVHEEEFGDAPVSHVTKGTVAGPIEIPFTRFLLHDLHVLYRDLTEYRSGDILIFKNSVGYDFFTNSKQLVIRPIVNNQLSTDRSEWWLFYHAHPFNSWTIGYDREAQRVMMIQFHVYPKQSGANIGNFYQIGV